eukprot:CAMPEP_0116873542 /NCGR_PEP_ID=MMETSP0463-20121206/4733_1 /TAXON_ID=181622 /ORGANISM="Strombidinopsis sp, Strain SopsisLIS2011" /LENGTH=42 /DNA_ID= /DNA_START= /DNA_END= /DNA_ORIENTATION=
MSMAQYGQPRDSNPKIRENLKYEEITEEMVIQIHLIVSHFAI